MKTPEERRFERIKDFLLAESSGGAPVRIASTRTLFGIKSHSEEVIEKTVAEMEAARKAASINKDIDSSETEALDDKHHEGPICES